jgi:hypothetical protein
MFVAPVVRGSEVVVEEGAVGRSSMVCSWLGFGMWIGRVLVGEGVGVGCWG